jgi:hypothetical protein
VISVDYQIVGGIKYIILFGTKYGPLNVTAITQYWLSSVKIVSVNFVDQSAISPAVPPPYKFNNQTNNTSMFLVSAAANSRANSIAKSIS